MCLWLIDHIHLIVNPEEGRIREFIGKLKGQSAMRIMEVAVDARFKKGPDSDSEQHVWQQSFKAQALWKFLDDLAED